MLTEDMMKKVDDAAMVMQKAREYINDLQAGLAMAETTNRELSARVRELENVNAEQYKRIKELEAVSKMETTCENGRKNAETQNWISVKDRLPPVNDDEVVMTNGKNIFIGIRSEIWRACDGEYYCEKIMGNGGWHFTHWMPLPQPPKEGK